MDKLKYNGYKMSYYRMVKYGIRKKSVRCLDEIIRNILGGIICKTYGYLQVKNSRNVTDKEIIYIIEEMLVNEPVLLKNILGKSLTSLSKYYDNKEKNVKGLYKRNRAEIKLDISKINIDVNILCIKKITSFNENVVSEEKCDIDKEKIVDLLNTIKKNIFNVTSLSLHIKRYIEKHCVKSVDYLLNNNVDRLELIRSLSICKFLPNVFKNDKEDLQKIIDKLFIEELGYICSKLDKSYPITTLMNKMDKIDDANIYKLRKYLYLTKYVECGSLLNNRICRLYDVFINKPIFTEKSYVFISCLLDAIITIIIDGVSEIILTEGKKNPIMNEKHIYHSLLDNNSILNMLKSCNTLSIENGIGFVSVCDFLKVGHYPKVKKIKKVKQKEEQNVVGQNVGKQKEVEQKEVEQKEVQNVVVQNVVV